MPKSAFVDIPAAAQAQRLAARRRARYGDLLAPHRLRWWADGRPPTAIAVGLGCSRSRVSRAGSASRNGAVALTHAGHGRLTPPGRPTVRVPTLRRSWRALLTVPPRTSGGCRTRWSGATRALTWPTTRGVTVPAETLRRGRQEVGWVCTRATLVANADEPQRVNRRARLRSHGEPLRPNAALVCADALESPLVPTVGGAWRPNGPQLEARPPGPHPQPSRAGALAVTTGLRHHGLGPRNPHALGRDRRRVLAAGSPVDGSTRLSVVMETEQRPKATAVEPGLTAPPRVTLLWWPTDRPRAHPMARVSGDGHDGGTRHQRRPRFADRGADVEAQLQRNGPWPYRLSDLDDDPAVTAAVEKIATQGQAKTAA